MSCYNGRNGRNTAVLAAKEESYGVYDSTDPTPVEFGAVVARPAVSMAVGCDITPVKNSTNVPYRTGTKAPQLNEIIGTTNGAEVTISGAWNEDYKWLLEAYTGDDAATGIVFDDENNPTYEIHRRHLDNATAKDDIVVGCLCHTLNFTAEQNGILMFEAVFTGQKPTWEQTAVGTYTAPTIAPFQFAGSTLASSFSGTDGLTSYGLSLTSERIDEAASYGNSETRVCDVKTSFSGECTYECVYDSTDPLDIDDLLSSNDTLTANFNDGTNTIVFYTEGKIMAELPDVENDLYKLSVTQTVGGISSAGIDAINIVIGTVA